MNEPTRGVLNNNPTNIRLNPAISWDGQVSAEHQTDKEFVQFVSAQYGIRAALVNLHTHALRLLQKGEQPTVAALCAIWAPPGENDTEAEINNALAGQLWTELTRQTVIITPAQFISLARGLVFAENGYHPYNAGEYINAWNMTGIKPEIPGDLQP